jgi:hypothetical protein
VEGICLKNLLQNYLFNGLLVILMVIVVSVFMRSILVLTAGICPYARKPRKNIIPLTNFWAA